MPNETTPDIAFPIESVKVETDRFCTQLTHRICVPGKDTRLNCKYEVYDHCIGTKVVQIVADKTYKFHDGCLGRVSRELAGVVRISDSVVIEPKYAQYTALALNFVLKPFRIASLNSKQKYDLVLFGARYGLPPINEVKVVNDLYCTQLTHRVARHEPDDNPRNLKYEVYDNCIGTKVVQIKGNKTLKFHDGCLGRVSHELGGMAKISDVVVIELEYAQSTELALNYILKPFRIASLTSKQKYDLVLFGARYGLPPNHISKLIDRSIYADLVGYAWKTNNAYLMTMLPKMRLPDVEIIDDFSNTDGRTWFKFVRPNSLPRKADVESGDIIKSEDKTRLKNVCKALQPTSRVTDEELTADFSKVAERNLDKFVRKYMEHEYRLKKYGRFRVFIILVAVIVWFALLYGAIYFDGPWEFKNKGGN